MLKRLSLLVVSLTVVTLGCGAPAKGSGVLPPGSSSGHRSRTQEAEARADTAMEAIAFAQVPNGTFGPFVARGANRRLAVWAAMQGDKRFWLSRSLGEFGEPRGEVHRIAQAAAQVGLAVLRPLGHEGSDGFVIVTTSREFGGERLDVLTVSADGTLRGGPTQLSQSLPEAVWIDAVPVEGGALVVWAVNRGKSATLHAALVGPKAELRGSVTDALSGARAWQVAATPSGAALAAVTTNDEASRGGRVQLVLLNDKARREGAPVVVLGDPTAEADLDLVRVGSRFLLAWSSLAGLDTRIVTAVVDGQGKVNRTAKPVMPPVGPQSLVRLLSPAAEGETAYIAWENLAERPTFGRAIRVAPLTEGGELGAATGVLRFESTDGGVPDMAATTKGVAAITLAPACRRGGRCTSAQVVPTYAVLDKNMDAVVSEPVRLEPLSGRPAEIVWGLTCGRTECQALAAQPADPAPVFSVQLAGLSNDWSPAARRYETPRGPHAATIETLASTPSVSDLDATRFGEQTLVSWVTYFDPTIPYERPKTPAPDGRYAPVRAVLSLASLGPGRSEPPQIVSYRARSSGGVAVSAAESGNSALLAWTALDQMQPQVFLTPIGADGRKRNPIMLTRTASEKEDVAVADTGNGWVVAWVDSRDGRPNVYAVKVNRQLVRIGPERPIATAATAAANAVQLLRRGDHVFAVWADARGQDTGLADLYGVRLNAKDASPVGPEQRLVRTADNSHSPVLAPLGDGAVLSWVDEPADPSAAGGAIMLARLDSGGELVAEPVRTDVDGKPRSVGLACAERACHVTFTVDHGGLAELLGFEWEPGKSPLPFRIAALSEHPRDASPPVPLADDVFYADKATEGAVRLRRINMNWTGKQ